MPETTNLAERLKQQAQTENETIQNLMKSNLESLRIELNNTLQSELSTIKADIRKKAGKLAWKSTIWRLFWPVMVGLSLCLGLWLGSLMLGKTIANQAAKLSAMEQNLEELKKSGAANQIRNCGTLEQPKLCVEIKNQKLITADGKTYVILREGR